MIKFEEMLQDQAQFNKKLELKRLKRFLNEAKEAYNNSHTVPMYDEDGEQDDDAYQENLEIGWWQDEQRELINSLEQQIQELEGAL